jgi:hypothetical protein
MSFKKRLLRILAILGLVGVFAGYFAFATLLFNPFEKAYAYDLSTLVPREVDFYVSKARLDDLFERFPRLAVAERLSQSGTWMRFARTEDYERLARSLRLSEIQAQLEDLPRQLGGLDPLDLFAGRDVACAGMLRGPGPSGVDVALYGRANWKAKLAVEALRYPALLALVPAVSSSGLEAAERDGCVELRGGALQRPLFLARVRDVVIASTSVELAKKAVELTARGGQDSFGQSALFADRIANVPRNADKDELELFVDWRKLAQAQRWGGRWPDPEAQDFLPKLASKLFQIGSLRNVSGIVEFERGPGGRWVGDLSSELMSPLQNQLYRSRAADRREIAREMARMTPAACTLMAFAQLDLGSLLQAALESAEPALRSNLEDTLRNTGQYPNLQKLLAELEALFEDRVGLILRDFDFPWREDDPPHNDVVVPAWALVLWHRGDDAARAKLKSYHDLINRNPKLFGIEGRAGERGVFTNLLAGGYEISEYWSPFVDGTGHIGTWVDGSHFIVSNSYQFLRELSAVYSQGNPPRLSDSKEFTRLSSEALDHANLLAWVQPRNLAVHLEKFTEQSARDEVLSKVDWSVERARQEEYVLREKFPGQVRGKVSPDVQRALNELVNAKLDELEQKLLAEEVPRSRARIESRIDALRLCEGLLLMVALDPKRIECSLGSLMVLEE